MKFKRNQNKQLMSIKESKIFSIKSWTATIINGTIDKLIQ